MILRWVRYGALLVLTLVIFVNLSTVFAGSNAVPETRLDAWTTSIDLADIYPDGTPTPVVDAPASSDEPAPTPPRRRPAPTATASSKPGDAGGDAGIVPTPAPPTRLPRAAEPTTAKDEG